MSKTVSEVAGYEGVEFYALRTRKNSQTLTGVVLIVARGIRNGASFACISRADKGESLPCVTWTHDDYLDRLGVKVDEKTARTIDPATFKHVDAHHRAPEYRAMYEAEIVKPGRSGLQRAIPSQEPGGNAGMVSDNFYRLYGH